MCGRASGRRLRLLGEEGGHNVLDGDFFGEDVGGVVVLDQGNQRLAGMRAPGGEDPVLAVRPALEALAPRPGGGVLELQAVARALGVAMPELGERAVVEQRALVDQDQALADFLDVLHVVGGEDDGGAGFAVDFADKGAPAG